MRCERCGNPNHATGQCSFGGIQRCKYCEESGHTVLFCPTIEVFLNDEKRDGQRASS